MDDIYINSLQPSIIYFSGIKMDSERMDAHFYHSKYINNEKQINESGMRVELLDKVILKMNSPIGWQGIPSESYLPEGIGVPLIRVQNVNDLMLDRDTLIGVQEYIYQEQPAIQAESDDIIITRVGTIGRVCRIPDKISKIAMGQNLTRIKVDANIVSSEYLTVFMATNYCQLQMKRYAYGGVQPSLTNKNIRQLLIPIPSLEIQEYIGNKVKSAEELREEAKKLREKNKEILENELELSKLEEIKIDAEKQKNKWIKEEDIEERIDGDFYHPRYNYYDKALFKLDKIGNHFKISKERINRNHIKEIRYIDLSSINNLISPQLMDVKDAPDRAQLKVKEGDVIISTLSGSKKVGIITADLDGCICTTGLVVLRSTSKILTPEYLHAIFLNELFNIQIDKYSSGAIMSGVANSDFEKMRIPIISNKSIVDKISDNTKEHFKKLLEAKKIIQEAKQDVEDLIEGNFNMDKLNESLLESR